MISQGLQPDTSVTDVPLQNASRCSLTPQLLCVSKDPLSVMTPLPQAVQLDVSVVEKPVQVLARYSPIGQFAPWPGWSQR